MRRALPAVVMAGSLIAGSVMAGCTANGSGTDGEGYSRDDQAGTAPGDSVLAVKVDNAYAARPQTGLDAADLVYAEQVEGGLGRLMAVYATKLPEAVGPVRSARESDLELLRQFDEPTLAYSGAQSKLLPLIDAAPLHAVSPGEAPDAYYRGTDKPSPHNLYMRPARLIGRAPGADALTTGFRYGTAPAGGAPEDTRTVRYPAARFTFTWSESRQRWLVAMDGTPAVTTDGERVAASTVVVQHVKVRASRFQDFLGHESPYTESVGSGKAEVLRDGRAYQVDWERDKATEGTEFTTTDGEPMRFAQGQVWVVYAQA